MEVHGQHTVSTGGGDEVGHQLCGDGIAGLGLTILTGVAEVGDHSGDTGGGSTAQCVDEDQQLHEAVVNGLAGGLDDEYVAATNGLVNGNGDLTVSKGLYLAVAHGDAQTLTNGFSQRAVGICAKNLDVLAVRIHVLYLSFHYSRGYPRIYFSFPSLRRWSAQPGLLVCRSRAMAREPAGTLSVMVEPAAT